MGPFGRRDRRAPCVSQISDVSRRYLFPAPRTFLVTDIGDRIGRPPPWSHDGRLGQPVGFGAYQAAGGSRRGAIRRFSHGRGIRHGGQRGNSPGPLRLAHSADPSVGRGAPKLHRYFRETPHAPPALAQFSEFPAPPALSPRPRSIPTFPNIRITSPSRALLFFMGGWYFIGDYITRYSKMIASPY